MKKKTTNTTLVALAAFATFQLSGCAFFNEPRDDLSAPVKADSPAISQPSPSVTTTAREASTAAITSYLIVAPIEDIPEEAGNLAVIHFTRNNTDRALALCKALTAGLQVTELADLPVTATNVVMWPVANDNAGATCLEMLTDYEPIDISVEASKRVNESSEGPFLLTQNMATGKRMIFDMSYTPGPRITTAIDEWQTLMGSVPDNWPPYRSAR